MPVHVEEWECSNGGSEVHVYFKEGGTGRSSDDYVFGFNPSVLDPHAVTEFLCSQGFDVVFFPPKRGDHDDG